MTTYCSSSSAFMTNKTPNGARKHPESTQPNSSKTAKLFFFFLLSDGLAQYCVNLSRWFTHETAAFSMEQARPHRLFTTSKLRKAHVATQTLRIPICDAIFFDCTYACALKDQLATTRNCYLRALN